jgi:hypothetical protein
VCTGLRRWRSMPPRIGCMSSSVNAKMISSRRRNVAAVLSSVRLPSLRCSCRSIRRAVSTQPAAVRPATSRLRWSSPDGWGSHERQRVIGRFRTARHGGARRGLQRHLHAGTGLLGTGLVQLHHGDAAGTAVGTVNIDVAPLRARRSRSATTIRSAAVRRSTSRPLGRSATTRSRPAHDGGRR